jgi:hypothetical protein
MIQHGFGSLFSQPDVRDYVATTSKKEFPEEFKLQHLPAVKNQGMVGSCVAHSLSTVLEWYNRNETKNYQKMSTGYIYGNRLLSLHKGCGMYTRDALKTISKYGDVPYEIFPQNVEVPDAISLFESSVDSIEDKGYPYKIKSYYKLKSIDAAKAHLLTNNPIVLSMKWFDDIKIVNGIMTTTEKTSKKTGGHCMVIFGWTKDGWIVQNSWGTGWGTNGRFILPFNISTKEMWGVTDADPSDELLLKKPYSSKLGRCIASVLNKIVQWFYNLKNKKGE